MSYRKNKVRAFLNLVGFIAAAVSIFLPEIPASVVIPAAIMLVALGR